MPKLLRLGMIGGGQGAFIGAVHRIASRIDDRYELLAGCLSSTSDKALLSAKEIGIDSNRSYPDFKSIFSKLSGYGFDGWAVLEWECCIKSPEQGAAEGAPFISNHIIDVTTKAFDDFADSGMDTETNKKLLGI